MTTPVVTDEQLGIYARREHDLFRRIYDGALPIERVLEGLQSMIRGDFDSAPLSPSHLIDCDARPLIPNDWRIEPEDQLPGAVRGQLEFDPAKIVLFLSERQKNGKTIKGNELRAELFGKPVLSACVLDHLLANTRSLIPSSWKRDEQGNIRYIFFWGTLYRGSDGDLYVRYLYWDGGQWYWGCYWLGFVWDSQSPAAILAS